MENKWITINFIEQQEKQVKLQTEQYYGKNRSGFCDYVLSGIELMLQGTFYLRDIHELNEQKEYKDFNSAFRYFAFCHYYRVIFAFKAAYNLLLTGYYTESAILLRSIVETFVRLKYIAKSRRIDYVHMAFGGHRGFQGKKFDVKYETQFREVASGLYQYYRELCDIAHGAAASQILKMDWESKAFEFDTGVLFKPRQSSFITNQFTVYLLAHLESMMWIFPEIKKKMPESYATKYRETLSRLWAFMTEVSKREQNRNWYNAIKQLVNT